MSVNADGKIILIKLLQLYWIDGKKDERFDIVRAHNNVGIA